MTDGHVAIVSSNFWPEVTGVSQTTAELASFLATRALDVRVATAMPYYPAWEISPAYRGRAWLKERHDGVEIHRAWHFVSPRASTATRILHEISLGVFGVAPIVRAVRGARQVFVVTPDLSFAWLGLTVAWLLGVMTRALDALMLPGVSVRDVLAPGFSLASTRLVRAVAAHGIRPATVIDVGANVGQFALAAARAFPTARVLSFEPVPDVAATLRRNVRSHPLVEVVECALGRFSGTVDFFRSEYTHVSSALPIHASNTHPNYEGARTTVVRVPLRRLEDAVGDRPLDAPVLLKLDVQGYEAEVLAGAERVLPKIEWLVAESSFVRQYEGQPLFESLDHFIRSLGYTFVAPVGTQEGRDGMIIEMDGLYRRASAP